jgi:hypothetical protein
MGHNRRINKDFWINRLDIIGDYLPS